MHFIYFHVGQGAFPATPPQPSVPCNEGRVLLPEVSVRSFQGSTAKPHPPPLPCNPGALAARTYRNLYLKQIFVDAHLVHMRTLARSAAFPPGDWRLVSEGRRVRQDFRQVPRLCVRCSRSRTCFDCLGSLTLAHSDNAQTLRCCQRREAVIS